MKIRKPSDCATLIEPVIPEAYVHININFAYFHFQYLQSCHSQRKYCFASNYSKVDGNDEHTTET